MYGGYHCVLAPSLSGVASVFSTDTLSQTRRKGRELKSNLLQEVHVHVCVCVRSPVASLHNSKL